MFFRRGIPSLPLIFGSVVIGIISGKSLFGPPLEEYWSKRLQEEAAAKETDSKQN